MLSDVNKDLALRELDDSYRKCENCNLHKNKSPSTVAGTGNPDADILMVLDRVPKNDSSKFRILTSSEESIFITNVFNELGIDFSRFYFTPVVLCPTRDMKAPVQGPVSSCRDRLKKEIDIVEPKLVIACGTSVVKSLLPNQKVSVKYHTGMLFQTTVPGSIVEYEVPVLLTYSITNLLREPSFGSSGSWEEFKEHMNKAVELVQQCP